MPDRCICKERHYNAAPNFAFDDAQLDYAPNTIIEPTHMDICLNFKDLASHSFNGSVTITFKNHRTHVIDSHAERSNIILNAISFDELSVIGANVSHTYNGKEIKLLWETPFAAKEERKVTIKYSVTRPVTGLFFAKDADTYYTITDHETERARYWLPCVDFPVVRTTLDFHISAPKDYISLANGKLIKEDIEDGIKTTHWSLDYPCPSYLICFAVGDFLEYDDGEVDGIPVKYYTSKKYSREILENSFGGITKRMIEWLQKKVGTKFPWPKYYQIAMPAILGAMENISLVTWTDNLLNDKTLAKENKLQLDSVNIHEMGHTYFGDLLVIRHFEHAWLKEGWATYISACWFEDTESKEEWQLDMLNNSLEYFSECSKYMRPVVTRRYDSSWAMFDAHLYPGSAWRIHMLRCVVGDTVFWTSVRNYIHKFARRTVETSDFQAALEHESGLNLTRFFDQWFYSRGYPQLKGSYQYNSEQQWVKLVFEQTQVNENENIPYFEFKLDVRVTDVDGSVFNHTVIFEKDERRVIAFIPISSAKPAIFQVDPDFKTLFSLELTEVDKDVLEATAELAGDIRSKIWAYGELIKLGTWSSLNTVKKLILAESFHGVRSKVAEKLGASRGAFSLSVLAELLEHETDPAAMHFIAGAAQVYDDRIREAIIKFLERDDLPYKAHAKALEALGVQKNPNDLDYLLNIANDNNKIGFHGLVRNGALKALGQTRSEEAFNYLITLCEKGIESVVIRRITITALRMTADWQERRLRNRAIDTLVRFLRDPELTVVMTTISSLVALGAINQYDEIESTAPVFPAQELPWLKKQLKALKDRNAGDKGVNALREEVDKLEERLKKLEKKLADKNAEDRRK